MSDENVSIRISDEVSPEISSKLKAIATDALEANANVIKLQTALKSVSVSSGLQKLQTELAKTGLAQQKLATEVAKTNQAYFNSEAALNRAIAAELKATSVTDKLAESKKTAAAKIEADAAKSYQRQVEIETQSETKKIALQRASITTEQNLRAKAQSDYERWWQRELAIQEQGQAKRIALQRASILKEEMLEKQRAAEMQAAHHASIGAPGKFQMGFTEAFDPHMIGMVTGMAVAFGAASAAVEGFSQSVQDALDMQTLRQVLDFAAGSAERGASDFRFLQKESQDLGVSLRETSYEFALMEAAAKGTSLEGKGVRDIFKSMSEAAVTLHLSTDSTSRGFYALREMIEMTTVQTRQMRMLAIALPGAFQTAAKAMGTTTEGFMQMMKHGQVMTDDFMPKFAAAWHEKFEKPSVEASHNARQEIQKFKNEMFEMGAATGSVFLGMEASAAKGFTSFTQYGTKAAETANTIREELLKLRDIETKKTGSSAITPEMEIQARKNAAAMLLARKVDDINSQRPNDNVDELTARQEKQIENQLKLEDELQVSLARLRADGEAKKVAEENQRYDKEKEKLLGSNLEKELAEKIHTTNLLAIHKEYATKRDLILKEINAKLDDSSARMFKLQPDREAQTKLDQIEESLLGKKVKLTDQEREAIKNKIGAIQKATEVQKQFDAVYNEANGPLKTYNDILEASGMLLKQGAITQEDYAKAVLKASEAYANFKDPLRQYNKDLNDQFKLLQLLPKQREVEQQIIQLQNKLLAEGVVLDSRQIANIKERLELLQEQSAVSQHLNQIYGETQGAQLSLEQQATALDEAFGLGLITLDDYSNRLVKVAVNLANLKLQMGDASFNDFLIASLGTLVSEYKGALAEMTSSIGNFFKTFEDGFASAIGHAIVFREDLTDVGDAIKSIAKNAIAELIGSLIKLGIQFVINAALGKSVETSALAVHVAESTAAAAATATAWAPAAALASLASFGGNSVPASAGIATTVGLSESLALTSLAGFEDGGYSGNVARNQIAGVVHGQEWILDADTTARVGTANLAALQSGAASVQRTKNAGQSNWSPGGINMHGDFNVTAVMPKGSTRDDGEKVGAGIADGFLKRMQEQKRLEKEANFHGVKQGFSS